MSAPGFYVWAVATQHKDKNRETHWRFHAYRSYADAVKQVRRSYSGNPYWRENQTKITGIFYVPFSVTMGWGV